MTSPEIVEERISKILEAVAESEISSIKSVVSGIIGIINDPRSTAKDLKELIQVDPPLSGKILKVSNSVYYSPASKIDEIEKAIIWIGYDAVKELALRQKTNQIFSSNENIEGYRTSELWTFCVGVALFSKMIFRREFKEDGDKIYTAGLLHKLGLITELQFLKKAFIKILKISNNSGAEIVDIENKVFGFNHAILGKHIVDSWSFPEEISNTFAYHVDPYKAPKKDFKNAATIYIASCMCRFAEMGYFKATPFNDEIYTKCKDDLGLDQDGLNMIIEEGQFEIAERVEKGAF
jgi:HD-like signal output (HDOD) protein